MPSKYSDIDSDASRLPAGFQRTGYDADTQTYTYTDTSNGDLYTGEPGNRYGLLHPSGQHHDANQGYGGQDMELAEIRGKTWWRRREWNWYLAPFLLIVGVYMLFLLRWVLAGTLTPIQDSQSVECVGLDEVRHVIVEGDTCWDIARKYGLGDVGSLKGGVVSGDASPGEGDDNTAVSRLDLDCDHLAIGHVVCVTPDV